MWELNLKSADENIEKEKLLRIQYVHHNLKIINEAKLAKARMNIFIKTNFHHLNDLEIMMLRSMDLNRVIDTLELINSSPELFMLPKEKLSVYQNYSILVNNLLTKVWSRACL